MTYKVSKIQLNIQEQLITDHLSTLVQDMEWEEKLESIELKAVDWKRGTNLLDYIRYIILK